MNKQTEALKMVIDNLELQDFNTVNATLIAYCKEALATNEKSSKVKPTIKESLNVEQPIATILSGGNLNDDCGYWVSKEDYAALDKLPTGTKLYTHQAPSWQGLSDDEINNLHHKWIMNSGNKDTQYDFARAIEQALKEKNNG